MAEIRQIQVIPSQVENTAGSGGITLRGTSANMPYNKNLLSKLQAIVGKDWSYDDSLFGDEQLPDVTIDDLQKLLTQVVIRFDNDPNYYTKRDYYYLIWYLCQSLVFLSQQGTISDGQLDEIYSRITILESKVEELDKNYEGLSERVSVISDQVYNQFPGQLENINTKIAELEALLSEKPEVLQAGSGIQIEDNIISARTKESFQVSKVSIGGYTDGMIIEENTPILEILKTILQKVVDVKANAPTVKLTGDTYKAEYGSESTETATITLTQGFFSSADSTAWTTNQKMNCKLVGVTDEWDWTIAEDGMSAVSTNKYIATSAQTFSVPSVQYSQNTVIPTKSNGEDSEVVFNLTATAVSGSIKVIPYYKLYFGPISSVDINSVTALQVKQLENSVKSEFPLTAKTTTGTYSGQGKSILIACPALYKLSDVTDGMGNSLLALFRLTNQIDIPCGNDVPVKYNLYLYPISTGADQAYKNLTFNLV